jgi:osmotically-inducible protein OsmY
VEEAIARSWSIDNYDIQVNVIGTTLTFTRTVASWYQKYETGRIVWITVGVGHVKNELVID